MEGLAASIRDYQLIQRIGGGAFGEVWIGEDLTGTRRAIKVLRPIRHQNEASCLTRRELAGVKHILNLTHHPNLCPVLHVGRTETDRIYYVMPLADNGSANDEEYVPDTLLHRLRNGPIDLDDLLPTALQLTDGLAHLHRHSLLHRDIKPANVVFCGGVPMIADVGLVWTGEKQTDSILGTPHYLPPEFTASEGSDIYALGKVIYEMATGLPANSFPHWPSSLLNHAHAERYLELNDVLCQACSPNRHNRYRKAEDLMMSLQSLRNQAGIPRDRLRAGLVLVILLVALVALALGFVLGRLAVSPSPL